MKYISLLSYGLIAVFNYVVYGHHVHSSQVKLVTIHPHDPKAFTEGLLFLDGSILESTGLPNESFIREYKLQSQIHPKGAISLNERTKDDQLLYSYKVINEYQFDSPIFGEGISVIGDRLYALTYKAKKILVLSRHDFTLIETHPFITSTGEGWGMTTDGKYLIISDGSPYIQFYDPINNFESVRNITVKDTDGRPVYNVNELEYVEGQILANVWMTNTLLRIDINDGHVIEALNFDWITSLVSNLHTGKATSREAVMNGIAYDEHTGHIFITGKLWDSLFELDISYLKSIKNTASHNILKHV